MPEPIVEAARLLAGAWREHRILDALPPSWRPADLAAGYATQEAVIAGLGEAVRGYKIAATSESGQRHIQVEHPISGQLPASRVLAPGATVPMGGNHMRVAEAEFVFEFAADLAPRAEPWDWDGIEPSLAALRPGIEVPNSRFRDFAAAGAAQLVADNACACFFVLGEPVAGDWRRADLAGHGVEVLVDARQACTGTGADALGDPRTALLWFVNHFRERGHPLAAGTFVTTGVCGRPVPVEPGQRVQADFGIYGTVTASLQADPAGVGNDPA